MIRESHFALCICFAQLAALRKVVPCNVGLGVSPVVVSRAILIAANRRIFGRRRRWWRWWRRRWGHACWILAKRNLGALGVTILAAEKEWPRW